MLDFLFSALKCSMQIGHQLQTFHIPFRKQYTSFVHVFAKISLLQYTHTHFIYAEF